MPGHTTTLRIKFVIPDGDGYEVARDAFKQLSEIHEDQAIFQINETEYVDDDCWGFQIKYETSLYTRTEFVQSTSLLDIERATAAVASDSFEQRISTTDESTQ